MRGRDLSNLVSLFGVQVANAAMPLIVFPHLLRVAGQGLYAQVVLSEAVALAVLTAALYSFDIDALTRVVGLDPRRDGPAISQAFSGVMLARLIMFAACAALALAGCALFAAELIWPLAWWLLLPLSHVLQSAWLFQGLERNAPIATAMVVSRVVCIALILWLVDGPDQYLLVPALVGSTALLGALGVVAYARGALGLRLCRVPVADIRALFRHGRTIFFGNASVFMYRDMNVVLLDAAGAGAPAVAAYSLAEKLVKGLQAAVRPLNLLFFPKALRAIRSLHRADLHALGILLRLTAPQILALLMIVVAMVAGWHVTADRLPLLRDLPDRAMIAILLALMIPAVFFGVANFMLGSIGLNHLAERRYMFVSLLAVGVLNLVACYGLARAFGGSGAALAFVLSEVVLAGLVVSRYLTTGPAPVATAPGE
jgi:PST family polysaccharide transporter